MSKITDGIIVFVEGNNNDWFFAKKWQSKRFFDFMKFGTQKSMCYPNHHNVSEKFLNGKYEYCIHIYNDCGPVYLENITTGNKREIKYLELYKSNGDSKFNPFNTEMKLSNFYV